MDISLLRAGWPHPQSEPTARIWVETADQVIAPLKGVWETAARPFRLPPETSVPEPAKSQE